jgi:hypothetical protein
MPFVHNPGLEHVKPARKLCIAPHELWLLTKLPPSEHAASTASISGKEQGASHVAGKAFPLASQLDVPETTYAPLHVGEHSVSLAMASVQSPALPLTGALLKSHVDPLQIASVLTPAMEQVDFPTNT